MSWWVVIIVMFVLWWGVRRRFWQAPGARRMSCMYSPGLKAWRQRRATDAVPVCAQERQSRPEPREESSEGARGLEKGGAASARPSPAPTSP